MAPHRHPFTEHRLIHRGMEPAPGDRDPLLDRRMETDASQWRMNAFQRMSLDGRRGPEVQRARHDDIVSKMPVVRELMDAQKAEWVGLPGESGRFLYHVTASGESLYAFSREQRVMYRWTSRQFEGDPRRDVWRGWVRVSAASYAEPRQRQQGATDDGKIQRMEAVETRDELHLALEKRRQFQRELDRIDAARWQADRWIRLGPDGERDWVYRFDSASNRLFAWNVARNHMMVQERGVDTVSWRPTAAADKAPEPLSYRFERSGPAREIAAVLRGDDGTELRAIDAQRMSQDAFLNLVRRAVRTKDSFYTFEELFLDRERNSWIADGFSPDLARRLRDYGKDLCGVTRDIERVESLYGVNIAVEDAPPFETASVQRFSVRSLEANVRDIERVLSFYPPDFCAKIGLKHIYLFDDVRLTVAEPTSQRKRTVDMGGFQWADYVVVSSASYSLSHEMYHALDQRLHGVPRDQAQENDAWASAAHGSDYANRGVYAATDGVHAIGRPEHAHDPYLVNKIEGFARSYGSLGGINEDQATIAEEMLASPQRYYELFTEAQRQHAFGQPALLQKIQMMQSYYKRAHPLMDETFWRDFSEGVTIDRRYWAERKAGRR